jgi:hypothetical protein
LLGLCLVCFFGYLIVQNNMGSSGSAEPTAQAQTGDSSNSSSGNDDGGWFGWLFGSGQGATPTAVLPTPSTSNTQPVLDIAISDTAPITLTLNAPISLQLDNQPTIPVQPQTIDPSQPQWLSGGEDIPALWAAGTVINYVIGLPGTPNNRTLLEQLPPGARLAFTTQGGQLFEFVMTQREWRTQPFAELLVQNRPGLTLLWLGDAGNGATLVIQGEYILPEEQTSTAGERLVVELGQPAQLGDGRITVTGATHLTDNPTIPNGFAYYLIDYTLENVGTAPLDSGLWQFNLVDDFGTRYPLNPQAASQGNYPPLPNIIQGGGTAQATAGYQIPLGLNSTMLRWLVNRVDTAGTIEVQIPFNQSGSSEAVQISLQQAGMNADTTGLIIQGQIVNQGSLPVTINATDITLEAMGISYFMLSTSPAFPWIVTPGQPIPFQLTFQRPNNETATLTILNQAFLLSGLR